MADHDISALVPSQFTEYFRENGPNLIAFIKAYYEWLEQEGNVLYYSRRHIQDRDVDATLDEFLTHFKTKYAPAFQFDTAVETRRVIKNALTFYRARGTDLSVEMFFKMVFGVDADVYHPGDDVFVLSSGDWRKDNYVEVAPSAVVDSLVGKEIVGVTSGATAFADRVVRRIISGRQSVVIVVSSVQGTFHPGELIRDAKVAGSATVQLMGSVVDVEVTEGGEGFVVGERVNITGRTGRQAVGIVSNVFTATGLVDFALDDGGWGYTSNAKVYVSDVVLRISNGLRDAANMYSLSPQFLAPVTQPMATLQYHFANGSFALGDTISEYAANGSILARGQIMNLYGTLGANGYMTVAQLSGNLAANVVFYNQSNAVTANVVGSGYTDMTATGSLLNYPTSANVTFSNATSLFQVNEQVYQLDPLGNEIANGWITRQMLTGGGGVMILSNCSVLPFTNTTMYGRTSNAAANTISVEFDVGLQSQTTFSSVIYNYVYGANLVTSGTIVATSIGYGASFSLAPTLLNTEVVTFNTDKVAPYLNVAINATSYGVGLHNANATNMFVANAMNYAAMNVGTISGIIGIDPGTAYTFSPVVAVVDPFTSAYPKHDVVLGISSPTGIFLVGETVSQNTTGAVGRVMGANSTSVSLRRYKYEDLWVANAAIYGSSTGYTATVTTISANAVSPLVGENAVIEANVISSNGSVSAISVVASGYAFDPDEIVSFSSLDGERIGNARVVMGGVGKTEGYYADRNGFLSDTKKLTDSYYYQPYSYDIKTAITSDKFDIMLERLLHISGKAWFASILRTSTAQCQTVVNVADVKISG